MKIPFFTKRLLRPIQIPQQEPYDPRKAKNALAAEAIEESANTATE